MGRHHEDRDATTQEVLTRSTPDARSGDAARETRNAQEAHGGSMAPELVDPTGHQVAGSPPAATGSDSGG